MTLTTHGSRSFYSREQRAKRACLHAHLATAARVKYPAALQRYKFDAPLLAAWSLTLTAVLIVSLTACGKVSNKPADVIQRENPAGVENSENSNGAAEAELTTTKEPKETGKAGRTRKAEKNTAKKEAKAAKQEPEEKVLTLEEVRAVLAEKSRSGHTEEVRELLNKHGADKLSEIDPAEYAALLAEAEVL